jgi:hypothetical protein
VTTGGLFSTRTSTTPSQDWWEVYCGAGTSAPSGYTNRYDWAYRVSSGGAAINYLPRD